MNFDFLLSHLCRRRRPEGSVPTETCDDTRLTDKEREALKFAEKKLKDRARRIGG